MASSLTGNQAQVAQFLASKGLTQAQIAGVMGNWQQETSYSNSEIFSVNHDDPTGPTGGLAQWHNSRLTAEMNAIAAEGGTGLGTLDQQLNYFWQEYKTSYPNAIANSSDPTVVARQFNAVYEGGTDPNGAREKYAAAIYPEINTSSLQQSSAGGGVSGAVGSALNALTFGGYDASKNAVSDTESTASAIGDIGTTLAKAAAWMAQPSNWLRVGYFVVGAMLVVVGGAKAVGAPNPVKAVAGKVI